MPGSAEDTSASAQDDPFASRWDEASLELQRSLLRRITTLASSMDLKLYLYWGTLIGHVREGRILPWDDDIDLALIDANRMAEFNAALKAIGLQTWIMGQTLDCYVKICDPSFQPIAGRPWTWPYLDLFVYCDGPAPLHGAWPVLTVQRALVWPGRRVTFEGASCWEPEQPLAVLDIQYEGWRAVEITSDWNHRDERPNDRTHQRPISTDPMGRKF